MIDGFLNFVTKVNTKGFNKGTKEIEKQTSKLQGVLQGALGTALGLGLAQMAGQVVHSLGRVADQAIELASDVTEVQNVVDTAFGSMAYKCEDFADIAIDQFGMSKLSAKQTASTYMAMAKSMGLSMDAASDMAIETAKLTGDVASFYNISTDLASIKLKSIFTGETETLKDLGVVMTEVNLKQFALQQGIKKSYSQMSQAEKVALRYKFVMNTLTDAQGDFARTSDSWANQTRILGERWKELLSIMGGGLIRMLTPVVQLINNILSALITLANAFANTLGKLFGFNKEIKSATTSAIGAAGAQDELADATAKAGKAAGESLASFDKLEVLQQDTVSGAGSGGITGGGMEMADVETPEVDTSIFDDMSNSLKHLKPYVDALKNAWDSLKKSFDAFWTSEAVQRIVGFIEDMAKAFLELTLQSGLQSLTGLLGTLSADFQILNGVINGVAAFINGDYKKSWENAKLSMGGVSDHIKNMRILFDGLPEWIKKPFNNVIGNFEAFIGMMDALVRTDWAKIWSGFKEEITARHEEIKGNVASTWAAVKTDVANALSAIRETISAGTAGFRDEMSLRWEEIKGNMFLLWEDIKISTSDAMTSVQDKTKAALDSIKTFLTGVFSPAWKTAWNGIKSVFGTAWNTIVGIVESAVNLIIDAVNWCINQINRIHVSVPEWVTALTGMTSFGFSIPNIQHVQLGRVAIPELATGAVIPPNGEFLAMLGDQKNGRNLEAPESLIRQIVREESGGGDVIINAKGTMGQIIRLLKLEIDKEGSRAGKSFVKGGAY